MSTENKTEVENEEVVDTKTTTEEENKTEDVTVEETEVVEDKYETIADEYKAEMEAKVRDSEDKYLRTHAEFENVKKRLEKEKYNAIDYASEKFAKDLLAPIDALQMAILSTSADIEPAELVEKLKEGIELTVKSFNKAFEKHDIHEVEYDEFNPDYHNAVMKADSEDVESGQIVMVMQKGYKFKDRLLREAMVSVAN